MSSRRNARRNVSTSEDEDISHPVNGGHHGLEDDQGISETSERRKKEDQKQQRLMTLFPELDTSDPNWDVRQTARIEASLCSCATADARTTVQKIIAPKNASKNLVYLTGFAPDTSIKEVRDFLQENFGPVTEAAFIEEPTSSHEPQCFFRTMPRCLGAYVIFQRRSSAEKAVTDLGGSGCHIRLGEEPDLDELNVIVKNLPDDIDQEALKETFGRFGILVSTGTPEMSGRGGRFKGIMFARYQIGECKAAIKAIQHFHGLKHADGTPFQARLAFKQQKKDRKTSTAPKHRTDDSYPQHDYLRGSSTMSPSLAQNNYNSEAMSAAWGNFTMPPFLHAPHPPWEVAPFLRSNGEPTGHVFIRNYQNGNGNMAPPHNFPPFFQGQSPYGPAYPMVPNPYMNEAAYGNPAAAYGANPFYQGIPQPTSGRPDQSPGQVPTHPAQIPTSPQIGPQPPFYHPSFNAAQDPLFGSNVPAEPQLAAEPASNQQDETNAAAAEAGKRSLYMTSYTVLGLIPCDEHRATLSVCPCRIPLSSKYPQLASTGIGAAHSLAAPRVPMTTIVPMEDLLGFQSLNLDQEDEQGTTPEGRGCSEKGRKYFHVKNWDEFKQKHKSLPNPSGGGTDVSFMAVPENYEDANATHLIWASMKGLAGEDPKDLVPFLLFQDRPPLMGKLGKDGLFYGKMYFDTMPTGNNIHHEFDLRHTPVPEVRYDEEGAYVSVELKEDSKKNSSGDHNDANKTPNPNNEEGIAGSQPEDEITPERVQKLFETLHKDDKISPGSKAFRIKPRSSGDHASSPERSARCSGRHGIFQRQKLADMEERKIEDKGKDPHQDEGVN